MEIRTIHQNRPLQNAAWRSTQQCDCTRMPEQFADNFPDFGEKKPTAG
jgi:hypothetical protein